MLNLLKSLPSAKLHQADPPSDLVEPSWCSGVRDWLQNDQVPWGSLGPGGQRPMMGMVNLPPKKKHGDDWGMVYDCFKHIREISGRDWNLDILNVWDMI